MATPSPGPAPIPRHWPATRCCELRSGPRRRNRISRRSSSRRTAISSRASSIYDTWRKFWIEWPRRLRQPVAGNFIGTDPSADFRVARLHRPSARRRRHRLWRPRQPGRRPHSRRTQRHFRPIQRSGINITQEDTSNNVVVNNIIGLSPDGTRRLSNATHGIDIDQGASDNTVRRHRARSSGTSSRATATSAWRSPTSMTTTGNQVIGNFIGTDLTGNTVAGIRPQHQRGHPHR